MVTMSTAIKTTDTAMDLCDKLEAELEAVEAEMGQRGSVRMAATGGGYTILNPGFRRKKVRFNELPDRDRELVERHRELTGEIAAASAELLESSAAELRVSEAVAA
jgi:hypothetical protein